MKRKTLIVPMMTALVGVVLGLPVGVELGNEMLAVVVGALLGVFIGLLFLTKWCRWVAVALLIVEFLVSFAVGGWLAPVLIVIAAALTFLVSAAILREFYGGDDIEAFWHHLQVALGTVIGFQVVEDGKVVLPTGSGRLMGPRRLTIRPGSAVVTVMGASQQAYGPSKFTTRRDEYVKYVYDLREKQKNLAWEDVLTADGDSASVKVCVTYALDLSPEARQGQRSPKDQRSGKGLRDLLKDWSNGEAEIRDSLTDDERKTLCNIPFTMPDWEKATEGALEQAVREAIRRKDDDALEKMDFKQVGADLTARTNEQVKQWGSCVHRVILEQVQIKIDTKTAGSIS
jgi:hypothetical protein